MLKIKLDEKGAEALGRFVDGGLKLGGVQLAADLSVFWPAVIEALKELKESKKED